MTEYMRAHVVRQEGDIADGPLRIIAATAGRKADGLNLAMDRADLSRFDSNPVVMYGHDYFGRDSLPIGKANRTWVDGDALMMDIEFDMDDPFAATVDRKYRAGVMNTFSIGFDAHDVGQDGVPARWELHEVSAVPIPLDPSAVVSSGRDGALMLAGALADLRAGKVLSATNKKAVEEAVAALSHLLESAAPKDDEDPRGDTPEGERCRDLRCSHIPPHREHFSVAAARLRLDHMERVAAH